MKNIYPSRMVLHVFHLSLLTAPFCSLKSHADHVDKHDFLLAEANHQINSHHDFKTSQRFTEWEYLIYHTADKSVEEKLKLVNDFFNKMDWVEDKELWEQKDYWATPIEFLASDGGDCEDFALAKYFTLKKLGIEEAKLNMTYVKALELNQAHMVVTYYEKPAAEPLVLDNLIETIELASKRTDLLPVFSFNGSSLWISKERGRGNMVGKSDRLALWNDLLKRMPDSLK